MNRTLAFSRRRAVSRLGDALIAVCESLCVTTANTCVHRDSFSSADFESLGAVMHSLIAQFHHDRICRLIFSASAWALVCVTRVVFLGSTRATRVMPSRQRSGTRLVVAVVFAVRLAKLLPASLCSLTPGAGDGLVRVYHYTNRAGYEGILKSGHIRPSDIMQADASYGSSVYATELDPSTPFWTILQNNYDMDGGIQGRGESRKDRADYVFAFLEYNSSLKFRQ